MLCLAANQRQTARAQTEELTARRSVHCRSALSARWLISIGLLPKNRISCPSVNIVITRLVFFFFF